MFKQDQQKQKIQEYIHHVNLQVIEHIQNLQEVHQEAIQHQEDQHKTEALIHQEDQHKHEQQGVEVILHHVHHQVEVILHHGHQAEVHLHKEHHNQEVLVVPDQEDKK